MKILRNVVAILALVLLLVLAFANAEPVRLAAFGRHTPELPLFVFLLAAFLLGYLVAALVGAVRQAALNRQIARLEKERGGPGKGKTGGPEAPAAGGPQQEV